MVNAIYGKMKYYNFPRQDCYIYPHIVMYIVHRKHNNVRSEVIFFF